MSFKRNFALLIGLLLIALDQLSKFWARDYLAPKISLDFIKNILEFRYAENTGVAFSFLASYPQVLIIIISSINIAIFYFLYKQKQIPLHWVLIFSGSMSNLLDRYLFGFVTDFINPTFVNFAIFNLADVFLNIGLYIYLFQCFFMQDE